MIIFLLKIHFASHAFFYTQAAAEFSKPEQIYTFGFAMSLAITSLNSGSNGNCYYVGNRHEAILVDAGISCRETERRMNQLGLSMSLVKAIFISHEHTDHISGLAQLAKKFQLPVYITEPTRIEGRLVLQPHLINSFTAHQPVSVGNLNITAFPKFHDASDPHSFIIRYGKITIGVFTDIGRACDHVKEYFKQCHAAFLETNYDEDMLINGKYPYHLKRRISGGHGHLSNKEALDLFLACRPPFMSHLFLSHLSRDNNDPTLVHNLFTSHCKQTNIVVASRYEATAVYHIDGEIMIRPQPTPVKKKIVVKHQTQLSLF